VTESLSIAGAGAAAALGSSLLRTSSGVGGAGEGEEADAAGIVSAVAPGGSDLVTSPLQLSSIGGGGGGTIAGESKGFAAGPGGCGSPTSSSESCRTGGTGGGIGGGAAAPKGFAMHKAPRPLHKGFLPYTSRTSLDTLRFIVISVLPLSQCNRYGGPGTVGGRA
jgi:hypothetical protein